MNFDIDTFKGNGRFRAFMASAILLFFYKLFVYSPQSVVLQIVNELIVLATVILLVLYLVEFMGTKKVNPLSLVMNIGILNAVIFFMITFSDTIISGLFDNIQKSASNPGLMYTLLSFIYDGIIIGSIAYIFTSLRELYFMKQKKNVSTYFNTMVVFILLASLTSLFKDPGLAYIKNTFLIISTILIVVNSTKISWIAFIVKKEKISLLVLSVVISVLFIVNLVNSSQSAHHQIIAGFSPALNQLLKIMMIYGIIYFGIIFFTTLFHIPTAEVFDRKSEEISQLQYFSKLITQVLDFNDLANTVTEITQKVCNADAAWIAWKEDNELKNIAVRGIGFVDVESITNYVLKTPESKTIRDTKIKELKSFRNEYNLAGNYASIAYAPLRTHNSIRGYLFAAKKSDFIFNDEDKNAIDTFSDYASIAVENSRLLEESIEKERLEKELDVAREIQRKILPSKDPEYQNLSVSSTFIPAFEVGGDYYDFFELENDKLGFVIADVSGKGISAAFIMAEVKGIFESLSKTIESPKEILIKVNQILQRTLERKSFVSAAYGVIDLNNETLTLARAGHCPLLLVRNKTVDNLRPSGIGLGLDFSSNFSDSLEEIQLKLEENDVLALYTDGITEAKNNKLEDFGSEKLEKVLLKKKEAGPDEIAREIINEVTLFSSKNSQHDDITLVILKWKKILIMTEN